MINNSVIQTIILLFLTLNCFGKNISLTDCTHFNLAPDHICAKDHHHNSQNGLSISAVYQEITAELGLDVQTIVLDAGHGGKDHGCLGANSREKEIALDVVLQLGEKIATYYPDIRIVYTRKKDVFVPLHERAKIANKAKADLFISIHCNAAGSTKAYGTETYVLGLHRAEDNLDVVKRENSSILMEDNYIQNYDGFDPNSPETHIILSMIQNAYLEQSIRLAYAIEHEFKKSAMNKSRGVKQAGFLVLRNTSMPSVLVELGFLSNAQEERYLVGQKGKVERVNGIFNAFESVLNKTQTAKSTEVTKATSLKPEPQEKHEAPVIIFDNELEYRLQLGSSKKLVETKQGIWKKISDIEVRKEGDIYKYLTGNFKSMEEARKCKQDLEQLGVQDVFLVAYSKGVRIPISKAREIELSMQ